MDEQNGRGAAGLERKNVSEQKRRANRENAHKSIGAKTVQGKERSKMNALTIPARMMSCKLKRFLDASPRKHHHHLGAPVLPIRSRMRHEPVSPCSRNERLT